VRGDAVQELCAPELGLIVLQSLIRGCSVGVQMTDGLSLNRGVMLELRTTNPLWADSKMVIEMKHRRQLIAQEHRRELIQHVRTL